MVHQYCGVGGFLKIYNEHCKNIRKCLYYCVTQSVTPCSSTPHWRAGKKYTSCGTTPRIRIRSPGDWVHIRAWKSSNVGADADLYLFKTKKQQQKNISMWSRTRRYFAKLKIVSMEICPPTHKVPSQLWVLNKWQRLGRWYCCGVFFLFLFF